ncbi:MAG TPA: methyl-accepting chemotaxis protein, partial [Sporomusaceae bacterium]|nr:methyl-accepting chemotaxis protein [Sporomusaceae bacterium]
MSIKAKLLTVILMLVIFIVGLLGINFYTFGILQGDAPAINLSGSLRMRAYKLALLSNQYISVPATNKAAISKEIEQEIVMYDKIMNGFEKGDASLKLIAISEAESKTQYSAVKTFWEKYKALILSLQNGTDDMQVKVDQISTMVPTYVGEVNKLVNLLDQSSQNKITLSKQIQLTVSVLGLGVALLAFIIIINQVIRPMRQLATSFSQVATGEGDLTIRLDDTRKDELGEVTKYFNIFIGNVQKIITVSQETSYKVSHLAEMLAKASDESSRAVEHVAVAVQEVAEGANKQNENMNELATST